MMRPGPGSKKSARTIPDAKGVEHDLTCTHTIPH